jgi:hypothetical protein
MNVQKYHIWTCPVVEVFKNKFHNQKIIIYAAEEFELILDDCDIDPELDVVWVFGGADHSFYKQYPGKVVLWQNFYMYDSFLSLNEKFLRKDSKITKIFISMNHRAHTHRCLLMDTLEKFNMFNKGFVSWRGVNQSEYQFKYWNPRKIEFNDGFLDRYGIHTLPSEFSHALINLVSESNTKTMFVTEKTYNAIFAEKPFIIQGPVGVHRYLSSLGFELYDEIFDYEFDSVIDNALRTEMIVQNLKNLENANLNKLKKLLNSKAKRNKRRALDIIKNKEYIPLEVYDSDLYSQKINYASSLIKK